MDAVVALAGAEFQADVDGMAVPFWTSVLVKAGSVLTIGTVRTRHLASPYSQNITHSLCYITWHNLLFCKGSPSLLVLLFHCGMHWLLQGPLEC